MGRVTNRVHLQTYVSGQLSDLDRKSVEPIADAAGVPPRTLQEFLSMLKWDEQAARDQVQRMVANRHGHPHSIGTIDETSYHKQGDKTACVQRQWCGSRGKMDNCAVSVHLGYVAGDFHTLLDGELFLPEKTWDHDRARCRAAGIPDDVVDRPKWEIALGQVERALGNGIRFSWLTFDEGYGGKPPFLRGLDRLGQNYVGEIPAGFVGWTRLPEILYREHARNKGKGHPRKLPRLKVRNTPPAEVREILKHSPILRKVPWERFHHAPLGAELYQSSVPGRVLACRAGKKTGTDDLPSTNRDASLGSRLESRRPLLAETGHGHCRAISRNPGTELRRQPFAPEANAASFTQDWRIPLAHTAMPMAEVLAL
jgi:hypothetical protein